MNLDLVMNDHKGEWVQHQCKNSSQDVDQDTEQAMVWSVRVPFAFRKIHFSEVNRNTKKVKEKKHLSRQAM